MNTQGPALRILALVPPDRRSEIARQLAPLQGEVFFVGDRAEAEATIREDDVFQVGLLPASVSDSDLRELWEFLTSLNQPPALLVYAREASFELWSGVLDSGGFDVIVEPFSDEELQNAVLRAAKSFDNGSTNGLLRE